MPHTSNRMETFWPETKEFIKKTWPKFTNVEVNRINGDYDIFLRYLKEFYGNFPLNEAIALNKLQRFFNHQEAKFFLQKNPK